MKGHGDQYGGASMADIAAIVGAVGGAASGIAGTIGGVALQAQAQKQQSQFAAQQAKLEQDYQKTLAKLSAQQQTAAQQAVGYGPPAPSGMSPTVKYALAGTAVIGVSVGLYFLLRKKK